jgi:hypothetical protein
MTWARIAASCLPTLLIAGSAAAETPEWRPGERVTSRVRGEVVPRDESVRNDGVYGRFDGDLALSIGAGAEFDGETRGALLGRALYYHTAGIALGYADSFGGDSVVQRVGFLGVELRPLFLPRWSLDLQFGWPLLDLTLDSLAVGAGAFVAGLDGERNETETGVELSLGLGIPLLAKAGGPWLEARGFVRPSIHDDGAAGVLVALSLYRSLVTPLVE